MVNDESTVVSWLRLIRADYLEVPGLHLTQREVQRMWGLDAETCATVLTALVECRFLRRTAGERYARGDSGG